MQTDFATVTALSSELLSVSVRGALAHVRLTRSHKRNAIHDELVQQLDFVFSQLPAPTKAVVLSGAGEHFCAGLDLSALSEQSVFEGVHHSQMWHRMMDRIQLGRVPVVSVLHGAVVGGGLELAAATHIRVAESSAFYALPEGQRGVFVGGGGSVRLPRLIGFSRMTDMMLTGRVVSAEEGLAQGISHYLVPAGEGLSKAIALAEKIATNAPLSNFAVTQALPRIADMSRGEGLFVESLMAAIAQADDAAKARMRAFLDGQAARLGQP